MPILFKPLGRVLPALSHAVNAAVLSRVPVGSSAPNHSARISGPQIPATEDPALDRLKICHGPAMTEDLIWMATFASGARIAPPSNTSGTGSVRLVEIR